LKNIYILKTGKTFQTIQNKLGDFDDWIIYHVEKFTKNIKVINIFDNEKLPSLNNAEGFIITGSHNMVSDELDWSLKLEKYIRKINLKNIPLLGICYGHQLISKALGGKSNFNKKGIEIGKVKINNRNTSLGDLLFRSFPKQFYAFETHYQSIIKLPANAVILASNHKDKHQAVRFSKYIWGVQFHPEFNQNIMQEYIFNQEKSLNKLGFNINKLLLNVNKCETSNKILSNFIKIIKNKI